VYNVQSTLMQGILYRNVLTRILRQKLLHIPEDHLVVFLQDPLIRIYSLEWHTFRNHASVDTLVRLP
jgi:hypothetical protein